MLKRVLNRREVLLCGFFPTVDDSDFEEYKGKKGLHIKNPWDRVKTIFQKDDYGNFHPDAVNALQNAQFGLFVGFLIGGVPYSIEKMRKHIESNDTTIYRNKKEANRFLNRKSTEGFVRGGLREGPKYGLFLGGFSLISSMIEAYRNRSGVIEFSIAGLTVGAFSRFWFGIRGMFVGGLIGGLLGTFYGFFMYLSLKLIGADVLQIKYAQYAMSEHRKRLANYKASETTPDSLESHHEKHIVNPLQNFVEGNG